MRWARDFSSLDNGQLVIVIGTGNRLGWAIPVECDFGVFVRGHSCYYLGDNWCKISLSKI